MVQWLRLWAANAEGDSLIPGGELRSSMECGTAKKKKKSMPTLEEGICPS